jgi:hypothetical protein
MFGITTRVVAIAAAVLIAGVGAWGGWQYVKLQKSQAGIAQAVADRDHAVAQLDKAIAANKMNQETIDSLQQEKKDIETSLKNLEVARKRDATTIATLSGIIKEQAKNPENQVTLSPVLKAVVEQIQNNRMVRQGEKK